MTCNHKRGDWIKAMGYWMCADCFAKLDSRPVRYAFVPIDYSDSDGGGMIVATPRRQDIVWQAEVAQADGLTLSGFIDAIAGRFMRKAKMHREDAYEMAVSVLANLGDSYGDPAFDWTRDGANEIADDEMQSWERESGESNA